MPTRVVCKEENRCRQCAMPTLISSAQCDNRQENFYLTPHQLRG